MQPVRPVERSESRHARSQSHGQQHRTLRESEVIKPPPESDSYEPVEIPSKEALSSSAAVRNSPDIKRMIKPPYLQEISTSSNDAVLSNEPEPGGDLKVATVDSPVRRPVTSRQNLQTNQKSQQANLNLADVTEVQDTYGRAPSDISRSSASSGSSAPPRPPPQKRKASASDTSCTQDFQQAQLHQSRSEASLLRAVEEPLPPDYLMVPPIPERLPNACRSNFASICNANRAASPQMSYSVPDGAAPTRRELREGPMPRSNLTQSHRLVEIETSYGSSSALPLSSPPPPQRPAPAPPLLFSHDNARRALRATGSQAIGWLAGGSARNLVDNSGDYVEREPEHQFDQTFPPNAMSPAGGQMSLSMNALSRGSLSNSASDLHGFGTRSGEFRPLSPAMDSDQPPEQFRTLPLRPKPSVLGSPTSATRSSGRLPSEIGSDASTSPRVNWMRRTGHANGERSSSSDRISGNLRSVSRRPKSPHQLLAPVCEAEEMPQHAILSALLVT